MINWSLQPSWRRTRPVIARRVFSKNVEKYPVGSHRVTIFWWPLAQSLNSLDGTWIDDPNKKLWIWPICFVGSKDESSADDSCIPSSDWTTHLLRGKFGSQKFNTKQSSKLLSAPAQSAWPQAKHIGCSIHSQRMFNASSLYATVGKCLIFEV